MTFAKIIKNALFGATASLILSASAMAAITQPTDLSGNILWLDATDFAVNGTSVATWVDKSGSGHDATAIGLGNQPVVNTTGLNGLTTVQFDGVDDGMSIDDNLVLARDYTIFIVDQYYGGVQGRTLQSRDANWLVGKWGGNNAFYTAPFVSSTTAGTTPVIGEAIGGSNYSRYYVSGTNKTSSGGAAVNGVPVPGKLGLVGGGMFNEQSQANISEIIIYDRSLSKTERNDVGAYLANKWNLPSTYLDSSTFADHGTVTQFTGADSGEGLDLDGNLVYKVNVGGSNLLPASNGTWVPDHLVAGVNVSANNHIPAWASFPELGASPDDTALNAVMHSIRWSSPENPTPEVDVTLDVIPGHTYKLQALFAENIPNFPASGQRVFEPSVNGQEQESLVVDINGTAGTFPAGAQAGAVYTHTFTATGTTATLNLSGAHFGRDTNPILNALTLEDLTDTSPSFHTGVTTIGNFTGGDFGEGIDLEGDFVHAVNVGGSDVTVRGVNFLADTNALGATVTALNVIGDNGWSAGEYGASADDDALEFLMSSIRWSNNPTAVDVALEGMIVGETYKLQILIDEAGLSPNRGYDIFVENQLIVDDLISGVGQDGTGIVVIHEFVALEETLNIQLSGYLTSFIDRNPILHAVTLELIPEPSSLGLLAIGMLVGVRRRKA